jgi:hypothetical protein
VDRLLRLDDGENPGLTETEFRKLFAQCNRCGTVMTRRVFKRHTCRVIVVKRRKVVIDLTSDTEEASDVIDLTSDTSDA